MSVFVILSMGFTSERVVGVFSTLDKAREEATYDSRIEEWTLDKNEVKFHSGLEED